jgi:prevent-host-death family protein
MLATNIASFKSHLGKFLRRVRQGEEVIVLDRKTPVARLVPYEEKLQHKVAVRKPVDSPGEIGKLSFPPANKGVDTLSVLLEDRGAR